MKKKLGLIIFGIVAILTVVISTSFAFFKQGVSNGSIINYLFKIHDKDHLELITSGPVEIELPGGSMASEVQNVVAILKPNDYNHTANATYNVYYNIIRNETEYSTPEKNPEIIIMLMNPDGNLVTEIDRLTYVSSLTGFDITEKKGLYLIAENYPISSKSELETIQMWFGQISFYNMPENLDGNSIEVEMIITQDTLSLAEENYYCEPGTYLDDMECKACPANSYCPGGVIDYTGEINGLNACSSLGDGSYTTSAPSTASSGECYKTCTKACTKTPPTGADIDKVTYGTTSTMGIEKFGGSCSAGETTCSATISSCAAGYYKVNNACVPCPDGYSNGSGTTGGVDTCSKSCTKNCTQTPPTGGNSFTYGSTSTTGTETYGGSCSAAASTCSVTITSCSAGYYKNGNSCIKCPTGYTSANGTTGGTTSCYVTTTAGKYIAKANDSTQTNCPAGSECAGGTKVNYGSTGGSSTCSNGYFSTGSASACTKCPSIYTNSDSGRDAQADCYINTTAGKYIKTANDSTETGCPGGYACTSAKVYYGGTNTGTACSDGYYATGAASSCSKCPTNYNNSDSPRNSQGSCTLTTTAGYYIKTAKDISQTQCPADSYCASGKVYYGGTGYSKACNSGYTSSAGAKSAADCCKWNSSTANSTACTTTKKPSSPKKGDTYTTCKEVSYKLSCNCNNGTVKTGTGVGASNCGSICGSVGSSGGRITGVYQYSRTTYTYACQA